MLLLPFFPCRNRAGGRLLHPPEWRAYAAALALAQGQQPVAVPAAKHKEGSPADAHVMAVTERMALAARVSGDAQERRFWTHLPSTLQVDGASGDPLCAPTICSCLVLGSLTMMPADSLIWHKLFACCHPGCA
jgi:hypothetical protein